MLATMTIRPFILLGAMLLPCAAQAQTASFENINTLEVRLVAALGAIAIRCEAIGWRIRVPLDHAAAAPMAEKAAPIVRKGDPVELFVETGSFSVSTGAIAQEDGAMGDRIRVRSDPKSPIMIAEVVDGGRVRVPGFK